MQRRELITLLGGAVLGWPRMGRTQQSTMPRVGFVYAGIRGTGRTGSEGLHRGLADLGYIVGRNLQLEERYANGNPERVASVIDELLALNVNVLVTPGTPITLAARRATSTVPIVCVTGWKVWLDRAATSRGYLRRSRPGRGIIRAIGGSCGRSVPSRPAWSGTFAPTSTRFSLDQGRTTRLRSRHLG